MVNIQPDVRLDEAAPVGPPRPLRPAGRDGERPPRGLRRPRLVLLFGLLLLLAGLVTAGGPSKLKAGGFDDASSQSAQAAAYLEKSFPGSQPNLIIMVNDPAGARSAQASADGRQILSEIASRSDARVLGSYFQTPVSQLLSKDGQSALTLVRVGGDEDQRSKTARELYETLAKDDRVTFGGIAFVNNETSDLVDKDLILAESIALPLTLLLLVFVFGSVVAALLPTLVGALAIIGSLGVLNVLSGMTDVSIFAVQLVTTLGLGLAVDYSLLIVARYREERAVPGVSDSEAVRRTMRTAGKTVLFSALIVGAALATTLIFPLYFLRSSAYAGLAVLALTLIGSLVILPAALLVLGRRIDAWSVRRRRTDAPPEERRWGRIAGGVMRRPALYAIPALAVLVGMMLPLAGLNVGVPDERMLPSSAESRQVQERLKSQFGVTPVGSVTVVAPSWGADRGALTDYATALSRVEGVDTVDSAAGTFVDGRRVGESPQPDRYDAGQSTWLQLSTSEVSYSAAGREMAEDVRAVPVPGDRDVMVGGEAAEYVDTVAAITGRLLPAAVLMVGLTLALLFLFTGSVVLPLKALAFNVIGLGSVLGLMVWIFQEGNFADLLGVTPAPLPVAIPVLFFCVAFGLSMDYEVFLLSRIREKLGSARDHATAVRAGLGASGPVVTAAAAILAVSFFSMAFSSVTPIKLFGLATGLAILLDAFVIRGVLLPAFLAFLGRRAWWSPRALRPVYDRFKISED